MDIRAGDISRYDAKFGPDGVFQELWHVKRRRGPSWRGTWVELPRCAHLRSFLVGSGSCAAFAWIRFVESVDEAAFIELLENPDVYQLIRLCGLCPRVGLADEFKLRLQTLAPGLGLPFLRTRVDKFE
jgi:hypothetical protein